MAGCLRDWWPVRPSYANRAKIHPLWEHLSNSYKLKDFLSIDTSLQRVKRKSYSYTIEEAMKEQVSLAKKAYIHNLIVDKQFYSEVLQAFTKSKKSIYADKGKQDVIALYEDVTKSIDVRELNDLELQKYIKKLKQDMTLDDLDLSVLINQHQIAFIELETRGKATKQEFPF